MGESTLPAWVGRIQDARIDIKNKLIDLEGEAVLLAERAEKLERTNAALLSAVEGCIAALERDDMSAEERFTIRDSARAAVALARGEG